MLIKIQAPSSEISLPQLSHEVSAQSLLQPSTLVPDFWTALAIGVPWKETKMRVEPCHAMDFYAIPKMDGAVSSSS